MNNMWSKNQRAVERTGYYILDKITWKKTIYLSMKNILCPWNVLSMKCPIYEMSYLYIAISMKFPVYELSYLCVVISMKYPVYEMSYLWNVLSMKCHIYEMSYLWNVLSMNCSIYELSYLWNVLSMKFPIYELSYLWNVLSMKCPIYEVSYLWNIFLWNDPTPYCLCVYCVVLYILLYQVPSRPSTWYEPVKSSDVVLNKTLYFQFLYIFVRNKKTELLNYFRFVLGEYICYKRYNL